jgi:hypothetical protein
MSGIMPDMGVKIDSFIFAVLVLVLFPHSILSFSKRP